MRFKKIRIWYSRYISAHRYGFKIKYLFGKREDKNEDNNWNDPYFNADF